MPTKLFSATLKGLEEQLIEVEIESWFGIRSFNIVGLPDKAVEESKERVSGAIKSIGLESPFHSRLKILVNLAPAEIKKEGAFFDLAIALGFLLSSKQIKFNPENKLFLGELALDGSLRPIRGALNFAKLAKQKGIKELFIPAQNSIEAALIKDVNVIGVKDLKEIINHLCGAKNVEPTKIDEKDIENFLLKPKYEIDFSWVKGQEYAKKALLLTAAGNHNLLMVGPPGIGKTLLAKTLPSIMPELDFQEALEITSIYSASGLMPENQRLINLRPFRNPHHTASEIAIVGGGNPPKPGEITLAHRGILFLDELPEFHRDVLESLRQPLESGEIRIARSKYHFCFPAKFTLIAAANPCPCGYFNHPTKECKCNISQIKNYQRKLSGPLADRIDLYITLSTVKYDDLISQEKTSETSEKIKEKVKAARDLQKQRFKNEKILTNQEMNIEQIKKYCEVDGKTSSLLKTMIDKNKISARGYHRVLRVSRTIADLEQKEKIGYEDVALALSFKEEVGSF
jgi:magnesium chelatase family protein